MHISPKNILVLGRSIGSGPAIYLATERKIGGLILISAFASIKKVIKGFLYDWLGFLANIVLERFDNLDIFPKVKASVLLIHGK